MTYQHVNEQLGSESMDNYLGITTEKKPKKKDNLIEELEEMGVFD